MSSPAINNVKQDSLELLRIYQTNKDQRVRNRIVELNMGLVRKEVHH